MRSKATRPIETTESKIFGQVYNTISMVYGETVKHGYNRDKYYDKYARITMLRRYSTSKFNGYDKLTLYTKIIFKSNELPWELNIAKGMKLAYGIISNLNAKYPTHTFKGEYEFHDHYIDMTINVYPLTESIPSKDDLDKKDIKNAVKLIDWLSNMYDKDSSAFDLTYDGVFVKIAKDDFDYFDSYIDEEDFIKSSKAILLSNVSKKMCSTILCASTNASIYGFSIQKIKDIINTYVLDVTEEEEKFIEYLNTAPTLDKNAVLTDDDMPEPEHVPDEYQSLGDFTL